MFLIKGQGAIYGGASEEYNENSQYAILEPEVISRENYSHPTYQIKDASDNVAIVINGILEIYQKLFEVNLVINDTPYNIAYSSLLRDRAGAHHRNVWHFILNTVSTVQKAQSNTPENITASTNPGSPFPDPCMPATI